MLEVDLMAEAAVQGLNQLHTVIVSSRWSQRDSCDMSSVLFKASSCTYCIYLYKHVCCSDKISFDLISACYINTFNKTRFENLCSSISTKTSA